MKSIPFSDFTSIHQFVTINSGERGTVFTFTIPQSTVGFINRIASNWFPDTKISFVIDGEIVFREQERQFGPVGDPVVVDPPYLVQDRIQITAINDDSVSHEFEALIDGLLIMRHEL